MTVQYLYFSAKIMPQPTEQLIAAVATLTNQGATEIHLLLSTPGGSVMHGITIYNTLRALPIKLVTHNMGNVDSIGNVIFLAGQERFACPIRRSCFTAWAGMPAPASDLRTRCYAKRSIRSTRTIAGSAPSSADIPHWTKPKSSSFSRKPGPKTQLGRNRSE